MKRIFIPALLFLAAAAAGFAQHVPIFPQGLVDFQGRTQVVANIGSFDLLAEGLGRLEGAGHQFRYRSITVGGYYRPVANLKVGAFYRLQAGALHDDDVIAAFSGPSDWVWNDTTGRLESLVMLDLSPRFLLDFLPGGNWVLMLKTRYAYNTFNGQQSILARPELTYFWMMDRLPVLNASLSYEMYFPLNFGSTLLYQAYPYLTLLWHATPEIGIELGGAYKSTVWSSSKSWVVDAGWSPYSETVASWTVSLGLVMNLSF
jgi:hypothetical protein